MAAFERVCKQCGKTFYVPNPTYKLEYCSQICENYKSINEKLQKWANGEIYHPSAEQRHGMEYISDLEARKQRRLNPFKR